MKSLLIGGSRDGEWTNTAAGPLAIRFPKKQIPLRRFGEQGSPYETTEVETYIRAILINIPLPFNVLVIEEMSTEKALVRIFENYRPLATPCDAE